MNVRLYVDGKSGGESLRICIDGVVKLGGSVEIKEHSWLKLCGLHSTTSYYATRDHYTINTTPPKKISISLYGGRMTFWREGNRRLCEIEFNGSHWSSVKVSRLHWSIPTIAAGKIPCKKRRPAKEGVNE